MGLEDPDGILAGLLCGVEGLVGGLGDVAGADVGAVLADADADGKRDFVAFPDHGGAGDHLDHSFGDDDGIGQGGVGEDDCEFITAVSGGGVDLADAGADASADLLDGHVAGAMAVGVVDRFEAVDVGHDN